MKEDRARKGHVKREHMRKDHVGKDHAKEDYGKRKARAGMVLKGLAVFMAAMLLSGCQKPLKENMKESMAKQSSLSAAEVKAGNRQKVISGHQELPDQELPVQNPHPAKDIEAPEPERMIFDVDDYKSWNQCLADNEISDSFQKSLKQFSFESGSTVLKQVSENGTYSPLSLYYALAMAGCGAEGETASQILNVLGAADQEELMEQCRKLYTWYAYREQWESGRMKQYGADNYNSKIQLANSLWISDRLEVKEDYQKMAADQFFASSFGVDFENPETGKKMSDWIFEKTSGAINPQITPKEDTLLAIVNTLYFYGGWITPFEEGMTKTDEFTREDGVKVSCPFLNRKEHMGSFKRGDGYLVSYLYTNNNCQMVFLLPDEGKTVEEFLESPEILQEAMSIDETMDETMDGTMGEAKWSRGIVTWKIPKFSFGSSLDLNQALQSMGTDRMFGELAEFGTISAQPLKVDSVIQEMHIGVDEQGVEGAAYTMIAMATGAAMSQDQQADMILDRPFLFGIRTNQDVWLFLGVCRDPGME